MRLIQKDITTYPIPVLLVLASDHITGATGKTLTVYVSKNGGAFGAYAGTVTERAYGWYTLNIGAGDVDTLGALVLHIEAAGCDPVDVQYTVINFNPFDAAALGLTRIDAAVSSRLATTAYTAAPTAADVWANATRTLTSAVNLGAIDVTLVEAESYVARLDFTLYKRVDYVTGARAGTVRFRYNINLSGATVKLVGAFRGRGDGQDINITGSAAVDPDDSSYYIVEFSVPTSVSDAWGTGDKAYLYEVRAYKNSIDDVLQRGWISVPDSPPVNAN